MAVASAITGVVTLLVVSPLVWWKCVLFSIIAAPFSAAVELFTHNGDDTVTVPVIIAVVLAVLCVI